MKIGIRIAICAILFTTAVTMATYTLADMSRSDAPQTSVSGFVLGEYDGRLAVYGQGSEPLTVTQIQLSGLRQADREMIREGIEVSTREELLALLEDLGS